MSLFFTVIEGQVVLEDDNGNAVGVVLDGSIYRLQTEAKVTNFPAVQPVSDDGGSLTVDATSWPLPTGAATEATLAALNVNAADIEAILTAIRDTAGIKKITDPLPAGTNELGKVAQGTKGALANAWPVVPTDAAGNAYSSQLDAGVRRLEIVGKVSIIGASPPPATTPAIIYGDNPLTVGTNDTTLVIPSGQTFFLQELVAGNEDPTKGAVVEVLFNNGSEHLVARIYIAGFTTATGYADRSTARDGTAMLGNGSHTVILRRTKFSGSDIAIDAVARGYTT